MKQVILKSSEECKLEEKMKCCPECGTKGKLHNPSYSLKRYKCPNEDCGCEWRIIEDEIEESVLPPLPPAPPFRTYKMSWFGRSYETEESKKARAKYEKELELWKKMYIKE